jgi:hypothetical protein
VMARQVIPTLSDTDMGQGSIEAELLLRSKEGRNHQGQVSPRTPMKGRIYVCNLFFFAQKTYLAKRGGSKCRGKLILTHAHLARTFFTSTGENSCTTASGHLPSEYATASSNPFLMLLKISVIRCGEQHPTRDLTVGRLAAPKPMPTSLR